MRKYAAAGLLAVGLMQMTGDLLHVPALKGIGAATTASPAPRVFSSVRGLETYSTHFFIEWTDRAGVPHTLRLTPERYAGVQGPYNRRNVYGAVLAFGPVLDADPRTQPMFESVARYALCGEAPLLRELGIDPEQIQPGTLRVRLEALPGTDLGDLKVVLEGALPMNNGWTGGQYSLFRVLFGTYLCVHFVQLSPWAAELFSNRGALPRAADSPLIHLLPNLLAVYDAPNFVTTLVAGAAGLSLLFALGVYDRIMAVLLWYLWACLYGRMPLIGNPSLPYVGWMLLAHACLPPAPYGSWMARGRADPGGGWRMPPSVFAAGWILMALGYSYSGYTKLVSPSWLDGTAVARVLDSPLARPGLVREAMLALPPWLLHLSTWGALALELSFAPLALVRRLRPWLWAALLLLHLSLITLITFADLSLGMVLLHLFTFDPAWIQPRKGETETLFYNEQSRLGRFLARFVRAEDQAGHTFQAILLDDETVRTSLAETEQTALTETIAVRTASGHLLTRTSAVRYILERLGGVWRLLGFLLRLLPGSWQP